MALVNVCAGVQGGLPVNYIVQKNLNNNMVDTLAAYFAPGAHTSDELSGEDDVFRNQVMVLLLCLHSNPQTTRPNKDIPIETARMWGIPDDENLFEVVIKQGRITLLTIPVYRAVGRDYFYNAGGFFKFILASDYGRYPAESHYGVLN